MSLEKLQSAAKTIETEGVNGYDVVVRSCGNDIANAILVTNLRVTMGSMESFPADPNIDERVKKVLEKSNIHL
ncbi:hypothetical protein C4565_02410 [Candidatus Parcubacteria bacterium]|nr:MAG: hypothetical protein C4565_02410 [Candidatus Parcubacteria bacterium]